MSLWCNKQAFTCCKPIFLFTFIEKKACRGVHLIIWGVLPDSTWGAAKQKVSTNLTQDIRHLWWEYCWGSLNLQTWRGGTRGETKEPQDAMKSCRPDAGRKNVNFRMIQCQASQHQTMRNGTKEQMIGSGRKESEIVDECTALQSATS